MPAIDFRRLREELNPADVVRLLGLKAGRGPCPIHGSSPTSRVFSLNLTGSGRFQCFKCGATGNALDLYATLRKLPIYVAANELCNRLGIEVPNLKPGRVTLRVTADGDGIKREVLIPTRPEKRNP